MSASLVELATSVDFTTATEVDVCETTNMSPLSTSESPAECKIITPVGFFEEDSRNVGNPSKNTNSSLVQLGITRPSYGTHTVGSSTIRYERQDFNPYAVSPIALFGSNNNNGQPQFLSNSDDSSDSQGSDKDSEAEKPRLSSYFNDNESEGRKVAEISPDLLNTLALMHIENDDLDSLDDGSSTESDGSSDDEFSTPMAEPKMTVMKRLLKLRPSSRKNPKGKKLIGISPPSYDVTSGDNSFAIFGTEVSITDGDADPSPMRNGQSRQLVPYKFEQQPVLEVHSSPKSVSTLDHSDQHDADFTSCFGSICEGFTWDANRVELLMPRFDAGKKDSLNHELSDPNSVENILRPWQVAFLGSINISTREQLVKAREHREDEVVEAMRSWRRDHNMKSFKKSQCALALHIWSRACKASLHDMENSAPTDQQNNKIETVAEA